MGKSLARWIAVMFGVLLIAYTGVDAQQATSTGTPTVPSTVLSGHTGAVTMLEWSPDGSLLASAAGDFESTDNTARLWSADGTPVKTLTGHSAPVASLAWTPDGKTLATGGFDGKIGLWSLDGRLIKLVDVNKGIVFKLAWSPDGRTLASGSEESPTSNTVQWWSPDGDLLITRTTDFSGGKFYNLGWSPDGKYLVGGATSYTEWQADGTPVFTVEGCASCSPAWGFTWSPDSSRWAIGDESSNITIYGVDGTRIADIRNGYGDADVLAWSPDGKRLASGGVGMWSPDGKPLDLLSGGSDANVLAWSPDGKRIAGSVGYSNAPTNRVDVWDVASRQRTPLNGHTAPVASLAWSPDGTILATGSFDDTIRLWKTGA